MTTKFQQLFSALFSEEVEFILVGGVAASVHGSTRLTQDIDIVYRRTPENLEKLVRALAPHRPYLRGAPEGLPFRWEVGTLKQGLNFTLITTLGSIDLLGEIVGGGTYDELFASTVELTLFGRPCRCLELKKLIAVKRAAGRPKDFEVIAELEEILAQKK